MIPVPRDTTPEALSIVSGRREIVFIENNVADFDTLIQSMGSEREVIVLDATQDGLSQIVQALEGRSGIDALHIVTHGSAGQVNLGSLVLDQETLQARASDVQLLGSALAEGGDVLLYGCDIGAGSSGAAFLDQLAIVSGADVAASIDQTGSSALGGDWELEVQRGEIETAPAVDPALAELYQHTLKSGIDISFNDTEKFDNTGGETAESDVIYNVDVGTGRVHKLKVDGSDSGVLAEMGGVWTGYSGTPQETVITFSFEDGALFTPEWLYISGFEEPGFELQAMAYTADQNPIGTTATFVKPAGELVVPNFNLTAYGMVNIAKLVIKPVAGENSYFPKLKFDSLLLNSITAPALEPKVVSVTTTKANGAYKAGETIEIDVTFDKAVSLTGNAALALTTGREGATASYASGSGSTTLRFSYTVQAGDNISVLDYAGNAALSVQGGAIQTLDAQYDAILTLPAQSLAASKTIELDTIAPDAPSAPTLLPGHDSGVSNTDLITNVIMPLLHGTAPAGSTVYLYDANNTEIAQVRAVETGVWSTMTNRFLAHGTHTVTAVAKDAAGNASAPSAALTFTVDDVRPQIQITRDKPLLKIGETANLTFTFTEEPAEAVTWDGENGSLIINGGTLSALQGEGLVRTATFTPDENTNDGRMLISLKPNAYKDIAGNTGSIVMVGDVRFDTQAPIAPSQPVLDSASDTGLYNYDRLTSVTRPTITGTAEVGATVNLYEGETLLGSTVSIGGNWSITTTIDLPEGEHLLRAKAVDVAGNESGFSTSQRIYIWKTAPANTVTGVHLSHDTGASTTDFVTSVSGQTVSGMLTSALNEDEYLRVSADNGASWTQVTEISGLEWSVHLTLQASGTLRVEVANVAGVPGPAFTHDYKVLKQAPTVTLSSDRAVLNGSETATITLTFSEDPGATFTAEDLGVTGGTIGALTGSGTTRSVVFTPTPGLNAGTATISVADGSYEDLAGNTGFGSTDITLTYDTLAPAAPAAPTLAAASDTGTLGDGRTTETSQVFEGTGDVGMMIKLYAGTTMVGAVPVNVLGKWSINATLDVGTHQITAVQMDAAGNVSPASAVFALTVEGPQAPPVPPVTPEPVAPLIDGMPVTTLPVTLPGGVAGTQVQVPVVTDSRGESSGTPGVADIPLQSSGGNPLLLAQIPVGYGLSANGANVGPSALEALIAAIRAATPTHAASDQGHLTANGQSFLDQLTANNLLVQTVALTASAIGAQPLILNGTSNTAQNTSLVLDGTQVPGAQVALNNVNFAAAIGTMTVNSNGVGAMLTGDAANQQFGVNGSDGARVFAGGGSDTLSLSTSAAGSSFSGGSSALMVGQNVTVLHAGQGSDVATFEGNRADWNIVEHNGYFVLTSKLNANVIALVVNAEQLRFADQTLDVAPDAGHDTLAAMYAHVLGRQADLYGFEWWADARAAGSSWGQIALDMIKSSEKGVSFNGDSAHDIALLYQALFNRSADADGLAFWEASMAAGQTLAQVANSMVESIEMVGYQVKAAGWDFLV